MKIFLVSSLWFVIIFLGLTGISGLIVAVGLPSENPGALGGLLVWPIIIISALFTQIGVKKKLFPGTKSS